MEAKVKEKFVTSLKVKFFSNSFLQKKKEIINKNQTKK